MPIALGPRTPAHEARLARRRVHDREKREAARAQLRTLVYEVDSAHLNLESGATAPHSQSDGPFAPLTAPATADPPVPFAPTAEPPVPLASTSAPLVPLAPTADPPVPFAPISGPVVPVALKPQLAVVPPSISRGHTLALAYVAEGGTDGFTPPPSSAGELFAVQAILQQALGAVTQSIWLMQHGAVESCRICLTRPRDTRIAPCGHLMCRTCVTTWMGKGNTTCPFCRGHIVGLDIVY
jgi:hypothetical protein